MVPLEDKTVMTGQNITDARVEIGEGASSYGQATIALNFDRPGGGCSSGLRRQRRTQAGDSYRRGRLFRSGDKGAIPDGTAVIAGSAPTRKPRCWRSRCAPAGCRRRRKISTSTVGASLGLTPSGPASGRGHRRASIVLFMIVYYNFRGCCRHGPGHETHTHLAAMAGVGRRSRYPA